ncbi:Hypothetical protein FKW44_009381, partial [Caligus rogercresseyi]
MKIGDYYISKGPEQQTIPTDYEGISAGNPMTKALQNWHQEVAYRLEDKSPEEIDAAIEAISNGQDVSASLAELE